MLAGVDGSSAVSCLWTSRGLCWQGLTLQWSLPCAGEESATSCQQCTFYCFFNEQSALLESLGEIDCSSVGEGGLHLSTHF